MTNKEWLERCKDYTENLDSVMYRQTKALEIIAEELIKLNKHKQDSKMQKYPR